MPSVFIAPLRYHECVGTLVPYTVENKQSFASFITQHRLWNKNSILASLW